MSRGAPSISPSISPPASPPASRSAAPAMAPVSEAAGAPGRCRMPSSSIQVPAEVSPAMVSATSSAGWPGANAPSPVTRLKGWPAAARPARRAAKAPCAAASPGGGPATASAISRSVPVSNQSGCWRGRAGATLPPSIRVATARASACARSCTVSGGRLPSALSEKSSVSGAPGPESRSIRLRAAASVAAPSVMPWRRPPRRQGMFMPQRPDVPGRSVGGTSTTPRKPAARSPSRAGSPPGSAPATETIGKAGRSPPGPSSASIRRRASPAWRSAR